MITLRALTNDELVARLKSLKKDEDKMLVDILEHIQEFEHRKLYLTHGYPSLYSYLTKELGYSENEAYRRIESARMLKAAPELKSMVNDGRLSLTALAEVRTAIRAEEKSSNVRMPREKQVELARAVVDCSKKEAQVILAQKLPHFKPLVFEQKRELTDGGIQITFRMNRIQKEKTERARNLLAHRGPVENTAMLVENLCDFYLKKKDLTLQKESPVRPGSKSTQSFLSRQEALRKSAETESIPNAIRRSVLLRDEKKCQYRTLSGKICGSIYQIELDHIIPRSAGGKSVLENLRCLCRAHNQWKSDKPVEKVTTQESNSPR